MKKNYEEKNEKYKARLARLIGNQNGEGETLKVIGIKGAVLQQINQHIKPNVYLVDPFDYL